MKEIRDNFQWFIDERSELKRSSSNRRVVFSVCFLNSNSIKEWYRHYVLADFLIKNPAFKTDDFVANFSFEKLPVIFIMALELVVSSWQIDKCLGCFKFNKTYVYYILIFSLPLKERRKNYFEIMIFTI